MYLNKDIFLGLEQKLWHKKAASWDREVGTSIGLCFKEKAYIESTQLNQDKNSSEMRY